MKTRKDFEEKAKTPLNNESLDDFWSYIEKHIEFRLSEVYEQGLRMIDIMEKTVVDISPFWYKLLNQNFSIVDEKLKENGYKLIWNSVFGYRIFFFY